MALVFQYGSNLSSGRINSDSRLKGDARAISVAYTEDDYELNFSVWSRGNNCAAADIIPGSGINIWGVVYEIPDYLIERSSARERGRKSLDAIEGEGSNYKRVTIRVKRPNGISFEEDIITYIGLKRKSGICTSLEYASHIIKGLYEHSIPNEYCDYVKAKIFENNPSLRNDLDGILA
jgi:hypothetical protein